MIAAPAMPAATAPDAGAMTSVRSPDAAAATLFSLFPSLNGAVQPQAPAANSADAQDPAEFDLADSSLAQWIMGLIPSAPAEQAATQDKPQESSASAPAAAELSPLAATAEPASPSPVPLLETLEHDLAAAIVPAKNEEAAAPVHAATPDAVATGFQNFENWLGKVEAPPAPAAAPPPMSSPAGTERWAEEFGQQVVWTAKQGLGSAEIHLHPEELGRVSVSLQLDHDQARLAFTTAQVHAGTAIEQALPRLRELFAHEGLNLAQVQVQVSTQMNQQQRQNGGASSAGARATSSSGTAEAEPLVTPAATVRRSGLLDDYA